MKVNDFARYNYRKEQTARFRKLRAPKKSVTKDVYYIVLTTLVLVNTVAIFNKPQTKINAQEKALIVTPPPARIEILPAILNTPTSTPTDPRVEKLEQVFEAANSPLSGTAKAFVAAADDYGLDYSLMPAISFKESSYARSMPPGTFNPFGLGGTKFMHFNSFEEAISFEASLLSKNYRYESNSAIAYKYCPPSECASNWAEEVTNAQYAILNK